MEQAHLIPGDGVDDPDGSMSPDGVFARAMAVFLLVDVALLASIFDTWDRLARHPVLYTAAALVAARWPLFGSVRVCALGGRDPGFRVSDRIA